MSEEAEHQAEEEMEKSGGESSLDRPALSRVVPNESSISGGVNLDRERSIKRSLSELANRCMFELSPEIGEFLGQRLYHR
ncbi:hypothetical protein Pmar_PMAR018812 [Perkinsus marinus ATCC 50983]|uniref:Uncharacterized protein n=1 Tax=Perkinsus marinus (strain ATCC 50983 / TXsc) TaxID=423536 RepID=C5KJF5_PERM5|nr:hypothetical protein Pmar_PMAR018812 [Perkinsus marinus ATCC 50983]EER15457.1 hypothetical protein Pmar_PMAR018812 [Perkinsus marinus ATCC 50983]|eukprot:XP_002783661.1 hypothetical protein Pmar_PMAR018812 [Perkinsus marinus ATCC 50983]